MQVASLLVDSSSLFLEGRDGIAALFVSLSHGKPPLLRLAAVAAQAIPGLEDLRAGDGHLILVVSLLPCLAMPCHCPRCVGRPLYPHTCSHRPSPRATLVLVPPQCKALR